MREPKRQKKIIYGIGIILVLIIVIAVSYSYWQLVRTQSEANVLLPECFDVAFREESSAISLTNLFPMTDNEGLGTNPYTFTIKNVCTISTSYQVNLEILSSENKLADEFVKVGLNDTVYALTLEKEVDTTISGAIKSYKLASGMLLEDEEQTFDLRMWMDEETPLSDGQNKTFLSKISVIAVPLKTNFLKDQILADVTDKGQMRSETPDFGVMPTEVDSGIYSVLEDSEISYYFRGTKYELDNNVIFAEHQWKIIRIDNKGNIKLIYNGACPYNQCSINDIEYNLNCYLNDSCITMLTTQNGGVKFNADNWRQDYTGYTHDYDIDSEIKAFVEDWYRTNLKPYDNFIADVVYCNDRSIASWGMEVQYGAYERLVTYKEPTFECSHEEDKYTKSSSLGNGLLKEKIGLITADEFAFAGGVFNTSNNHNFLNSSSPYWTLSPSDWFSPVASGWYVSTFGSLNTNEIAGTMGARPVIALNSKTLYSTGDGSIYNPYVIE